ncbi:hypothetical protein PENANT_c029G08306 [Penicillium antarcticum]|uniref:Alpha-amylase n=1 Tax=Penicillium antarcticum TaxID=416450 RepID=A0A1V6PXN4_9EURO|nr:uncharacterized protein N7508_001680 [Penicillium antarcticum]KAJ5317172.1 hypothetical protein N7508_001680 [Penicillium antarcticum]OQD81216.1 hypothetical protein PENANT_c029G08306 [Penicillium antarcticum]
MVLLRFAWLASLLGSAIAATPAQWRSQSIYFMLTDRFARTDGSTTAACDASMGRYCGGTWKGIENKLDYIQGMGFTAIWITPVTAQLTEDTKYGQAYHGYWQQDIYGLNSHYGTADDLKDLASALHKRGMYLMVDVVANHMGYDGSGDSINYDTFDPFNEKKYFHSYCEVNDYSNQTNVQDCWLGDTTVSLPDLDTEREDVRNMWYDWVGSLVSNYSIDGLRVDTVKHVEKSFWPGYNKAAGVYCIGEVFDGDADYTCPYQKVMDGLLNYPMYYPLLKAFKSTSGSMSDLYDMINTVKSTCADSTLLGNFVENHDNPRFASYTDDMSLAKNAAAFTIMADGIPIIYAGQEQHYKGGNDPHNREATWLSKYNTDSELYKLIAKANAIRNQAIYKSDQYTTYKNYPIYKDDITLAMRKGYSGSQTITILSNLGESGSSYTLSLPDTGFQPGDKLMEIITCTSVTVDSSGKVPVSMTKGQPRILYPASLIQGASLCS